MDLKAQNDGKGAKNSAVFLLSLSGSQPPTSLSPAYKVRPIQENHTRSLLAMHCTLWKGWNLEIGFPQSWLTY